MALKMKNSQVDVKIDGIRLTYYVSDSDAELLQKTEELINAEIDSFRKNRDSAASDYNKTLIAVMIKIVRDFLRKEAESEDSMQQIKEINLQLASYLEQTK